MIDVFGKVTIRQDYISVEHFTFSEVTNLTEGSIEALKWAQSRITSELEKCKALPATMIEEYLQS